MRPHFAPDSPARSLSSDVPKPDIRAQLREELKQAMKAKDTSRSITIRSIIAEITNADKANKDIPISHENALSLLQKSIARRVSRPIPYTLPNLLTPVLSQTDSASQFRLASRVDLAKKEEAECQILRSFLPAQLSEAEIERRLREAFTKIESTAGNVGALTGKLMKVFYQTTERSSVQGDAVSKIAREIIQAAVPNK
ncbi:Altered inheritance of mitochondria protein 41 [Ceratobasidium theobromae]|uniref:Altered inheritance of mitochondria protein 41 n=1 Tax=Ceratobasidium theobromae TaxID=1582974 RepID=A0A5N5QAG0_9AGAM|nr:Altered inheritance of mitochondria protein 41 [Ceratobasidium theobromae]